MFDGHDIRISRPRSINGALSTPASKHLSNAPTLLRRPPYVALVPGVYAYEVGTTTSLSPKPQGRARALQASNKLESNSSTVCASPHDIGLTNSSPATSPMNRAARKARPRRRIPQGQEHYGCTSSLRYTRPKKQLNHDTFETRLRDTRKSDAHR